jgi:hypothetical protein
MGQARGRGTFGTRLAKAIKRKDQEIVVFKTEKTTKQSPFLRMLSGEVIKKGKNVYVVTKAKKNSDSAAATTGSHGAAVKHTF